MRRTVTTDDPDRKLLALLREDGRMSTAALARKLGVARTTVVERMKRLERDGIVAGYTVRMHSRVRGRMLRVHVLLSIDPKKGEAVVEALRAIAQVRGVYAISGAFDNLVFVEGETTQEIDRVLDAIGALPGVGKTQSSLVLSVKFDRH
ncbi:MAG: Lrp/AsnC family transcriptional regulator [Betaproteobacteria bacterium]|nr:Lrp/AsnC family transcriptional regulator [Betaproteobacteria bacterium]